ncbi:uncharacterized protein [Nicotiana tomentosiformis]|uniref:uncharacterized protein n=1 Tax=Nicotiana tomentosiformis TaxID=4098 RepID=UPI00388CB795
MNAAMQVDLSPRQIDKVKSIARGRRKQQKEMSGVPGTGVQTRRIVTKFIFILGGMEELMMIVCIFKRLDRCLANMEFQQMLPGVEVTHLSKTGSDHCPLIISCDLNVAPIKKSFKFLKFWIKHETFLDVVKDNWNADFSGNPFILFNYKIKKLKKALTLWSKATYGNIFQKVASLEDLVIVHEIQFELHPTPHNRERLLKVQADFIRYLQLEEEFWKQKAGMNRFQDGDKNTKFFHAQEQFREYRVPTAFGILDHVPNIVLRVQNEDLIKQPTKKEVKRAVFGLNRDSAGGLDGFNGSFYQACGDDVFDMVRAFFNGQELSNL